MKRLQRPAHTEFRWPLLLGDKHQDALDQIGSRDVRRRASGNDAQPAAAVRADGEINREYSAQSLHPCHGSGWPVLVAFIKSFAQRLRAGS